MVPSGGFVEPNQFRSIYCNGFYCLVENVTIPRFEDNGLRINTYAGPESVGGTRRHVQLSIDNKYVLMDITQWQTLAVAIRELGPMCDQKEI